MPEQYVTNDKCHDVSTMILEKLEQIEDIIKKDNDTLYGVIQQGQQKGGLVNLVNDVGRDIKDIKQDLGILRKNSNSKTGLSGKNRTVLYSSFIGSMSAILVTLINCFMGK